MQFVLNNVFWLIEYVGDLSSERDCIVTVWFTLYKFEFIEIEVLEY